MGNGKVDLFGDSVLCQNLPGDGWRIRHDRIKQEMVVGRFNEVSNDLNNLVEKKAESRVNLVARRDGRQLSDNEKGVVVGQLRRRLSTAAIRAGSNCLLDRMHQCGQGAQLAAKRREGSSWLEEAMKKEREVQWLAKVRGGQLVQKGRFLVSD